MKGAVWLLSCAIALTHAELEGFFANGCPKDTSIEKLLPHEQCDQFYQCHHGTLIARFCPSGLHYNPELETCDWSGEVQCKRIYKKEVKKQNKHPEHSEELDHSNASHVYSICSASDSNGILVAHQNCNDFYKCSYGKPVALTCARNLLYNPLNEKCDWPQNVDCGERVIFESVEQNTNFKRNNNDLSSNNDEVESANVDPSQAISICATVGSDGVLVAHENCNQFFKCFNNVPVSMKCPSHLLYNPIKEYCDWPRNVECEGRSIPDNDDINIDEIGTRSESKRYERHENEIGSGDDVDEGSYNDDLDQASTICAAQHSAGILVPHENCNQFYKCSNGRPVALQCPADLVYNTDKFYCDWPHNVDCGDRTVPDESDGNDGNNSDNENTTTTEAETVTMSHHDPSQASAICNSAESEGVLVAHENCNEFYKCFQKRPIVLRCQGDLLYSTIKEYCDWPTYVDCGDRKIPEKNNDKINSEMMNGDGQGVGNTNVDPSKAAEICAAENSNGILIAHENCNQFYKCFDNKPVALFCQLNLLYNPAKEYCDWPQNVVCAHRVLPRHIFQNSTKDESNIVVTQCTGQPDGIIVPHENCSQFYKCLSGQTFPLDCPPGLYFNAGLKVCDWPMNVNCGDRLTEAQAFNKHAVARRALRLVIPIPVNRF